MVFGKINKKEIAISLVFVAMIIVLWIIPTGFEKQIYYNAEGVEVEVLEVDNSLLYQTGLVKQGEQLAKVKILSGKHKGEIAKGVNLFSGKLSIDKVFSNGDRAFALVEMGDNNEILFINLVDHYRLRKEAILIAIFALLLFVVLGFSGFRTLVSFAFALLTIWKVLIPCLLKGYDPLIVALLIGNIITIVTLLLAGGFTKKSYAAILSSILTSLVVCGISIYVTNLFKINGVVMSMSESLLYAGFQNLNLDGIYQGAIYLASSGAILDLAIDISSALYEVVYTNPMIKSNKLFQSGFRISRSIVGSQTTTLLLAYMGSFITVLMVYTAQGTPMQSILTSKVIASEIVITVVGCMGLVLVSPLTSFICSIYYPKKSKDIIKEIDGERKEELSY